MKALVYYNRNDTSGRLENDQKQSSQFSQALAIHRYPKFVIGTAVSMLTYPFLLISDLMAVNNCGLTAGLPSTLHCKNTRWTNGST